MNGHARSKEQQIFFDHGFYGLEGRSYPCHPCDPWFPRGYVFLGKRQRWDGLQRLEKSWLPAGSDPKNDSTDPPRPLCVARARWDGQTLRLQWVLPVSGGRSLVSLDLIYEALHASCPCSGRMFFWLHGDFCLERVRIGATLDTESSLVLSFLTRLIQSYSMKEIRLYRVRRIERLPFA